jgi:CRISPR-associated protein Cst2
MSSAVFEIAILGRAVWNLHSLNNEGTIGNVSEPRTVVLADGTKSDGISGEMLKHIHARNVWLVSEDRSVFCKPCSTMEPQRADKNPAVDKAAEKAKKDQKAFVVLNASLKECALCDLHGFLRTREAVPRSSTVEFGWAVAVRNGYHREMHLHARHAVEGRTEADQQAGEVSAQMIYHRPTRSGSYALVTVFQPWRIGLNEVSYQYVQGVDRNARYRLALEAYKATFARTDGAMTSTRLPHVEDFDGVVLVSTRNFPVPVTSPLQDNYRERLEGLRKGSKGLELHGFDSLVELYTVLDDLATRPIFELRAVETDSKGKD